MIVFSVLGDDVFCTSCVVLSASFFLQAEKRTNGTANVTRMISDLIVEEIGTAFIDYSGCLISIMEDPSEISVTDSFPFGQATDTSVTLSEAFVAKEIVEGFCDKYPEPE